MTKKIRLFDQEVGFYTLEIQNEKLEGFPHLLNEAYVLGLSILQEENDDTWALGLDQLDGAVSPWFEDLQQLEEYCRQAGSREAMRDKKSRFIACERVVFAERISLVQNSRLISFFNLAKPTTHGNSRPSRLLHCSFTGHCSGLNVVLVGVLMKKHILSFGFAATHESISLSGEF